MSNFPVSLPPSTPSGATMAAHNLDDVDGAGLKHSTLLERLILDVRGAATKVGIDASVVAASLHVRIAALETYPIPGLYGDGSDGNVTVTTTVTLARDMFYNTLTINSGGILRTGNFRVFCKTACIVNSGGIIQNDGTDATGTAAAAAWAVAGSLGNVGAAGGAGGNNAVGASPSNSGGSPDGAFGGPGGNGGAGSSAAGGTGGPITPQAASNGTFRALPFCISGFNQFLSATAFITKGGNGGGGGGGGGGIGGGGGSGAGTIVLVAKTITNNGTIRAKGGNGGPAAGTNSGGGGGGGGGLISIVCNTFTGTPASVAGGTGGAKNGTGVVGSNGSTGTVVLMTV